MNGRGRVTIFPGKTFVLISYTTRGIEGQTFTNGSRRIPESISRETLFAGNVRPLIWDEATVQLLPHSPINSESRSLWALPKEFRERVC